MIITLVVVGIFVGLAMVNNSDANQTRFEKQPPIDGQPTIGDPDAPVTVVEFGDFKCPSCKVWGESYFPQLMQDYVDTGKVKLAYVNVLFHGEESILASLAAESVFKQNPEAYWEFHHGLFAEQANDHNARWVTPETILEVASNVEGIDTDLLADALENQAEMAEVQKDDALVKEFKVQYTPTIMVNDVLIDDPFDYEAIQAAIEKALEEN